MTTEALGTSPGSGPLAGIAAPAADGRGPLSWQEAVRLPAFRSLMLVKRRVLTALLAGALGTFFAVMLLAGFARDLMIAPVGPFRLGYLLILGLYAMCWVLGVVYARLAAGMFDPLAALARRGRSRA